MIKTYKPVFFHDWEKKTLGFDKFFNMLTDFEQSGQDNIGYPPYNIIKIQDSKFLIELAVAGFSKEEIEIVTENNSLIIYGDKQADLDGTNNKKNYLYRGIANRSFKREFKLADTITVKNSTLQNGILYILLENIIPEELKSKKIEISDLAFSEMNFTKLEEKAKQLAETTAEKI